jgi:hypothetical protein
MSSILPAPLVADAAFLLSWARFGPHGGGAVALFLVIFLAVLAVVLFSLRGKTS